ncbi:hypothetical protein [Accumulibacter sp.]|uniref:hypothetical protein n=1 Tax=Accumulibacter sp. TaxID=2053492 RepID=UPI00258DEC81|nr:hypothetical protein [Accumulibacter sp.]
MHDLNADLSAGEAIGIAGQLKIVKHDIRQPSPGRGIGGAERGLHARVRQLGIGAEVNGKTFGRGVARRNRIRVARSCVVDQVGADPDAAHAGNWPLAQPNSECRRVGICARRRFASATTLSAA